MKPVVARVGLPVLLVEDSDLDAELAFAALRGHSIVHAPGIEAANAAVAEQAFSGYLLDQHLHDGQGAHWLLQRREAGDATPAIGLLGGLDDGTEECFFEAGANCVMRKEDYLNGAIGDALNEFSQDWPSSPALAS